DCVAVFATRIVIRHEHAIGVTFGNRCHLRALALITLAAAAEHADQLSCAMGTQAGQCLLEGVRRVRVIDDNERQARAAAEAVHASCDGLELYQRMLNLCKGIPERAEAPGNREQVVDVEATEQRTGNLAFAPRRDERELQARITRA